MINPKPSPKSSKSDHDARANGTHTFCRKWRNTRSILNRFKSASETHKLLFGIARLQDRHLLLSSYRTFRWQL
ncbi:hypothetical protein CYMTET_17090 [Cymbomonas tetramitiformis]|uniref:Uncharacterized protein n=1 Tax=Cymbomonas tetramitiformis TaxID=36881 RepID=A0AAE0GB77_9CHLO|nr:hypothetical protein CYMTET_17090 [Cymbomonas tetramitiformis]